MSRHVSSPLVPFKGDSVSRINTFFDEAELIAKRSGTLLTKCEATALRLFLFAHLIFDLIFVAWCIVTKLHS